MRIRDKEIFVLFVIGFTFVFILLCSGYSTVLNWLWQYRNQTTEYQYNEKYYIHAENSYFVNELDNILEEEQGYLVQDEDDMKLQESYKNLCKEDSASLVDILANQNNTIYISDLYLQVGEDNVTYDGIDIVFSYKDAWYRELEEGQYPCVGANSHICAVIGESYISKTVMINGKRCIWIGDMYVEVCGVFKNCNASGDDYSLVVFGGENFFEQSDTLKDRLAEYLNNDELKIIMGSSGKLIAGESFEDDINESDNFYVGEPGYLLKMENEKIESGQSSNIWDYLYNIKSLIICIMVILGILNCSMLSRVWAIRRRRDFLVMRIYGLNNKNIIFMVFKEMLFMAGIGMLIAGLISIIYISATGGWQVSNHVAEWFVVVMLLGLVVTIGICIMSVLLFSNKLKPAEIIRK